MASSARTKKNTILVRVLPIVLLLGCNGGSDILGAEGDWTVSLTKDNDDPYCQLGSEVTGRKFGIRLYGDRSTVYSSNTTWNVEDGQTAGLKFYRASDGFILGHPGPIPVEATVVNHEVVAQLTPETFELIAQPFLLNDLIDRVTVKFPGSEGRWKFSTEEPRRLGNFVASCMDQLKVING